MSRRALGELTPRLGPVLPFTLKLGTQELRCGTTPLVDDRGSFPLLVADLYRDGIRRIRLEHGVAEDELCRLLITLATPLDASDLTEDYVTRLWEAELPHVRIFAVDPYLDQDTPEDVLEGKVESASEPEEVTANPELKVPPPPDSAFKIEPEDEARVAQEVEHAAASKPWNEFVNALFDTVTMPTQEQRSTDLVEIFEAYFYRLVRELQVGLAAQVLEQLRSSSSSAAAALFGPSLARIAQADRLVALHEALQAGTSNPKDAVSLLVLLSPESVDAACTFLKQTTSERLRRLYADPLTRIGGPGGRSRHRTLAGHVGRRASDVRPRAGRTRRGTCRLDVAQRAFRAGSGHSPGSRQSPRDSERRPSWRRTPRDRPRRHRAGKPDHWAARSRKHADTARLPGPAAADLVAPVSLPPAGGERPPFQGPGDHRQP